MWLGVWAGPGDDVGLIVLRKAGSGQELHNFFILYFIYFVHAEKGFKRCGYDDFIEDLNAVNTTPFSHPLGLSLKRLQLCICASYSDKHIQVQFLNCGSHSSKPASCLSQFH